MSIIKTISAIEGDKQGEELFKVEFLNNTSKTFKSWDYDTIYSTPLLYEKLFCDLLGYKGFQELGELLIAHRKNEKLKILDVACGNGLMGLYLKQHHPEKCEYIVGTDISTKAIEAIDRDYPHIYKNAVVINNINDLFLIQNEVYNCLTICGGAEQVKLEEIVAYIGLLSKGAYITFNLRTKNDATSRLEILQWMNKNLHFCESKIYQHRKLGNGSIVEHEAFLYQLTH